MGKAPNLELKAGDRAPDFSALDQDGKAVSLRDFAGKHVVLYFYPKDNTPGCTKEACGFRDEHAGLQQKGAVVLGVSVDAPASHAKFASKYRLPFKLLADTEKAVVHAFGVWGQKSFLGRKYMGTHRVTFWIGPDGRIRKIWTEVKANKHAAEVLQAIAEG